MSPLPLLLHMLPPTFPLLLLHKYPLAFCTFCSTCRLQQKGGFKQNLFVVSHYQYRLLSIFYFKRKKALNTWNKYIHEKNHLWQCDTCHITPHSHPEAGNPWTFCSCPTSWQGRTAFHTFSLPCNPWLTKTVAPLIVRNFWCAGADSIPLLLQKELQLLQLKGSLLKRYCELF